ncbi:hypothetical protein OG444_17690 [Streptomyces sp. NBC_01232]|uniref:hypothetical protein n=1 Tax=Streptomyces sp. NBC_01232 TaxID=2903786 RepID=UPI002E135F88|nr:hypothetical protein OG444_17690 [Streptomyces sp. NBC_01232]
MTHRSRTRRLALLCASTALVTAGLLPSAGASAAPAPACAAARHGLALAPPPPTEPAGNWVKTTDPPSGITTNLPGTARVHRSSVPVGDETVDFRAYGVEVPQDGAAGFTVHDMPGDRFALEDNLKGFLIAYNQPEDDDGTLTSSQVRRTTADGRPALDARLSSSGGAAPEAGFIRIVSDDDHLVMAITIGPAENRKTVEEMHERLVSSLHVP